ncbi:MAG TPA: SCP2 sterol-binding domain-containing protein [Thermoanaerobaculia bacterium]|nr:SCP2 sterol-binding domain-containing protein [Thermoanaerobaculia bacterium]
MTQGGKPIRATLPPKTSPFAPLKALVSGRGRDVEASLSKLSQSLGSFETPLHIHVRLIDGDATEDWDVAAGSKKGAARRGKPKNPDVRVVLRKDTWIQIAGGKLSPYDALFGGKLRIGGDVDTAKEVVRHLSDPSVPYVSPC